MSIFDSKEDSIIHASQVYQFPKVNSDLIQEDLRLGIGNTPF
ncbi:MAG TPA: hypothetical protein PLG41_21705 [Leptospiraceae bacterium]|nr:hypothetical protein [Leptospiraceae bacterium]